MKRCTKNLILLTVFSLLLVSCLNPGSDLVESNNSSTIEKEQNLNQDFGYKPDISDFNDCVKLNRENINIQDSTKMYLMVRFLGKSEKGFWKKQFDDKYACPKGFALDYNDVTATTVLNFNERSDDEKNKVGYVIDYDLGFTDFSGNKFYTNFYYGDNNMSVSIDGKNDITFSFASFAIWDPTITGEFMGHPDFVRYPNNKFKITIPMKDYNPKIHNNVVYLTVHFEPDKGITGNLFPYQVVFDGFEPK